MFPVTASDWIAFGGIAVPLAVIAFSAAAHVLNQIRTHNDREFRRFFELADAIGKRDGSIVSKTAAIFELRKYTKYKGVITRICENVEVEGTGSTVEMLRTELMLTKEYFREN